ncbi:MAG: phosphopentomutase, partial [Clostridia bacterium]|nr:phosphopentomutase [Clostridia bacterium]
MSKRVFLIILDSMGVGEAPDAYKWGDEGSDTLGAIRRHPNFDCPNLTRLGLFNIEGVGGGVDRPEGAFGRLRERSNGKDTTTGHWEIAGLVSEQPFPTYPDGFPDEVIAEFSRLTGRGVLCNRPYSGTAVISDYGREHIATGDLIVYTSADSVFQIAAHEDVVPVDELYRYCEIARGMLQGRHGVGRVIARPFAGEWPFVRTPRRHDFSLVPPKDTMIDRIAAAGLDVLSVGKIYDIFAGKSIPESECRRTGSNAEGMALTDEQAKRDFEGLCFVNLVDFDMTYGHRNDVPGYAAAMTEFDRWLGRFLPTLRDDDILMISADHGCDPSTPSTDHSREYIPLVIYGKKIAAGTNIGTRATFADISATILDYLGVDKGATAGNSFLSEIIPASSGFDPEKLYEAAEEARKSSVCPYSGYSVGAALLTADGRVFTGCNIESATFTPTSCAERSAAAVA